jgi:WD40 repeat protein
MKRHSEQSLHEPDGWVIRNPWKRLAVIIAAAALTAAAQTLLSAAERQLTHASHGHILTNTGVWSPDGHWIVYDVRSDAAGSLFDGHRIEAVNVETSQVKLLYKSKHGAFCGVATWQPRGTKIVFILGPENPSADWLYGPTHRQGVTVDFTKPGVALNLDACDLTPPFTRGALRGGSHVHVWDASGDWLSFTYNDALVESDVRDVGVAIPAHPVRVSKSHPRNHDGNYFCALVTRTTTAPKPGSDEICRACEEGWIGANGYVRNDGMRQRRALAFIGNVITANGGTVSEVFVADLPEDLTQPGDGPLAGTSEHRPCPPKGVTQRRLTFTTGRKFPGLQGPRHWLRASPDGSRIAFLMKDDAGIVQLWTISPNGGAPAQLTHNARDIASAFSWSPDGRSIAHVMDKSVCVTDVTTAETSRLAPPSEDASAPRPEACVFSPDGNKIAFVRRKKAKDGEANQICVVFLKGE